MSSAASLAASTAEPTLKPGRGRVYTSITETIGDTPLVEIGRLARDRKAKARILAKLDLHDVPTLVRWCLRNGLG